MPLPLIAAGVGLGLGALGNVVGELFAGQSRAKQMELIQKAVDQYGNIDMPKLQNVIAEELGPSSFNDIKADPRFADAQLSSLNALDQIGKQGLTEKDRADLNETLGMSAQRESAGRARIEEDLGNRGQLGGGAELAMKLSNQQNSANGMNQNAMRIAAIQKQRAMDAILARGKLAGDIRGQEFGEKSRTAEANDIIARQNAAAREKAKYYNASLPQQQFGNQMQLANARAGAYGGQAGAYGDEAQHRQDLGQAWGNFATGAIGDMYKAYAMNGAQPPPANQSYGSAGVWATGSPQSYQRQTPQGSYGQAGNYWDDQDDPRRRYS